MTATSGERRNTLHGPQEDLYEIDSVKIAKQKAESYAASWRIKDRTWWSGRPPPKRKKRLHTE
jgi:hypothetical protein